MNGDRIREHFGHMLVVVLAIPAMLIVGFALLIVLVGIMIAIAGAVLVVPALVINELLSR